MRIVTHWVMNVVVALLLASAGRAQTSASPAARALDLGDHTSATLTAKAWEAAGRQEYEAALALCDACMVRYGVQARQMQAALTPPPAGESSEETAKRWALNDVGTCAFIKGNVLLKLGDRAGATVAFTQLVQELAEAQCWDPKGWYWRPAEAAKQKLVELEFDADPPAPAATPTP